MMLKDFLENISNMTEEELEKSCIPAPLDDEENMKLTSDYWIEKDGIRLFKKPLKVDYVLWGMYIIDHVSLILRSSEPNMLYAIAFSVSDAATEQLGNVFSEEHSSLKGYGFFPGFASEEVNSID